MKRKTHEEYENALFEREAIVWPIDSYVNAKTKIKHECLSGHVFMLSPDRALAGVGCAKCSGRHNYTTEEYQQELINRSLEYKVLTPYINSYTSIRLECTHGHIWDANPSNVLFGTKCPVCTKSGFDPSKPAIMYYVRISKDDQVYYKIGITNRTVKQRFKDETDKSIVILSETYFDLGADAIKAERAVTSAHKSAGVTGFLKSGNTELFAYDVLNLENNA